MKLIPAIFRIILMLTVLSCVAKNNTTSSPSTPEGFSSYYDEGTDGYYIDLISYQHPDWDYDKVEDSMFLPDSAFQAKYHHNK